MPWQLSCHGMCKIETWLGHIFHVRTSCNFMKFGFQAHKSYVKWVKGCKVKWGHLRPLLIFPGVFCKTVNSSWPDHAIWYKSGSTMAKEMACCLTAPNHYLNQYWFIINGFCGTYLRAITQEEFNSVHELGNYISKIIATSPMAQWVESPYRFTLKLGWS